MEIKSFYSTIIERRGTAVFFTVFTRLLSLVLLVAGTFEFIPAWFLHNPIDQVHLWHIAELTALAMILLGYVAFALSLHPHSKPLLALFFVLSSVTLAIGIMPFDGRGIVLLVVALLLAATYPHQRARGNLHPEGPLSVSLLVLTLFCAALLLPRIQQEVSLQIIGTVVGDSHAKFLHWIGSALLFLLLILGGGFSATKRPGWKTLAVVTGVTYCFLGLIAMLIPYYAGSWGEAGGLFAIIGGFLYILFMLVEAEKISIKQGEAMSSTATMHIQSDKESI